MMCEDCGTDCGAGKRKRCSRCYQAYRKAQVAAGTWTPMASKPKTATICAVCGKPEHARGLCLVCYQRWLRHERREGRHGSVQATWQVLAKLRAEQNAMRAELLALRALVWGEA